LGHSLIELVTSGLILAVCYYEQGLHVEVTEAKVVKEPSNFLIVIPRVFLSFVQCIQAWPCQLKVRMAETFGNVAASIGD
jgi:hypothetical protein